MTPSPGGDHQAVFSVYKVFEMTLGNNIRKDSMALVR